MLGQPVSMVLPPVLGFKLTGSLPPGVTATDLVLTAVNDPTTRAALTCTSKSAVVYCPTA